MTVKEIKQALKQGLKVYWSHDGYEVRRDNIGQYLIVYQYPYYAIGLTNKDGNLNADPSKFYIEREA